MSDTPLGGWWDENDYGDPGSRSIAPDTPSVCPTCKSPSPKNRRLAQRTVGVYRACRDPRHSRTPAAPGSSSPATAALVAELRGPSGLASTSRAKHLTVGTCIAAADALEAQAARITELEAAMADHTLTTPTEETE